MQSKLPIFILLICLMSALMCPLAIAKPSIDLDFYKNNGYSGFGNDIAGNWIVIAVVSSDVQYVEFYLDDQLQQNDTSAPFNWQFDTSNYPTGLHAIKAVCYDEMGDSAFLQVERDFQDASISTTITIIVVVVVIAIIAVAVGFSIYRIKKGEKRKLFSGYI